MTDRIRRIAPNPPGRRWGEKTREYVGCIRELVQIGDVFAYALGCELCGIDLQGADEHLRDSIKAHALEYGIVLEAVPGVGYQRLSEPGKVDKGHSDLHRVHRKVRRLQAEQATVQVTALSDLDRHRYMVNLSIAGSVSQHTEPRYLRQLAERREMPALPVPFDLEAHKDVFTRTPRTPGRRAPDAPA